MADPQNAKRSLGQDRELLVTILLCLGALLLLASWRLGLPAGGRDVLAAIGGLSVLLGLCYWPFAGTARFAIVLLLVLAVASIIGTVLEQIPTLRESQPWASEQEIMRHLNAKYGSMPVAIFLRLGFFDIYHCWWFIGLLWLISASLAISSARRAQRVWKQNRYPKVESSAEEVKRMQWSKGFSLPTTLDRASAQLTETLHGMSYQVRQATAFNPGSLVLLARRGLLGNWGSFISHISVLLIFAGAAYGNSRWGGALWDQLALLEGESQTVPGTNVTVTLCHAVVELDQHWQPYQWRSALSFSEPGRQPTQKTIWVNHPAHYGAIGFYQIDFQEPLLYLTVALSNGKSETKTLDLPLRDEQHGLARGTIIEPQGASVRLYLLDETPEFLGKGMKLFLGKLVRVLPSGKRIYYPARVTVYRLRERGTRATAQHHEAGFRKLGELTDDEPMKVDGVTLTMRAPVLSVLTVKRNLGLPLIYGGCILLVAGLFVTFYIWPRTIRVYIGQQGNAVQVIAGAITRGALSLEPELDRLARELRASEKTSQGETRNV